MLRRLGAVQLDTISVLARSHELVAYARLGAVGRERVERAYWSGAAFEYWSHAACVLPVEEWPMFAFRRRWFRARGQRWHKVGPEACDRVLEALRANGPMTVTELGGGRRGADWWDWSDAKIAVEWLLDLGEVICTERRAWKRIYDLPERVLAPDLVAEDPDDATCLRRL
ncbi:MAG TPA: crosslink repair DNA glycosylase YcaQ family protein, partial [Solirubrobacteraceae bacterium]